MLASYTMPAKTHRLLVLLFLLGNLRQGLAQGRPGPPSGGLPGIPNVGDSMIKISINPDNTLQLARGNIDYYVGAVTAECDGSENRENLFDLFLEVSAPKIQLHEIEKLQDRPGVRVESNVEATKDGFDGNLFPSKKLKYTITNPNCDYDNTTFTCTVTATGRSKQIRKETLRLRVPDGKITISPVIESTEQFLPGDELKLTCTAIVASPENKEDNFQVNWAWEKKKTNEENSIFKKIYEGLPSERMSVGKMKDAPCSGASSTSYLNLVLDTTMAHHNYRCVYFNPATNGSEYSDSFKFGHIGEGRPKGGTVDVGYVYSLQSLIGMILGILSFFLISFLGTCYVYRKRRTGKKYEIVTALLEMEEAELAKIEATLGTASKAGILPASASASFQDTSEAGQESSFAPESSVAEESEVSGHNK